MAIPTKSEIINFSPINRGGKEELPEYKRKCFNDVKKRLKTGLIVSVTGLRRVGKTTLIKQLLQERPGNSFYFSFDEKKYANSESLKRVLDVFLEESETRGVKPLIALDEVFRVEDWAGIIKRYHDQKLANFIVTGSSSLYIKKGIESLSGRMLEFNLPPLSFEEYLEMIGKNPVKLNSSNLFKAKVRYEDELQDFFVKGSFPETVKMDIKTAIEYIRTSTIEKIVFDDIPSIFKIEYPSKLYDLLRLCATNSSHTFSEVNFAEALQISRHPVSDYLLYLNRSYLVDILYPVGSFQKALKKQKKIFVKTASIYNALSEQPNLGQAAETAVFDKLSRYQIDNKLDRKILFYRDPQKREVDFIFEHSAKSIYPIEVKYQSSITSSDLSSILYYMKQFKRDKGIIVTKDLLDERKIDGKTLIFIPLDLFLLFEF
jgi:predicted AAA+ superfamily ATPase